MSLNVMRAVLSAAALALAATGALSSAQAQEVTITSVLVIAHPWASPTLAGQTGAVYFTISNAGRTDDRLIAARTDVAQSATLHANMMTGDVMKMQAVDGLTIPAGGELPFAPGGYHVMLMGVKTPLAPGDTFPMTLTFEHAGDILLTVKVETLGQNIDPSSDHSAMDPAMHHQQ
jgi:copper(I)-binding protein